MATITKRKVKGHVYYYLVEGKRVDGKSRLVKQQYLGRAEQVVAQLQGDPPKPRRVRVAEYGGSQALLQIARRLRLVDWIDAVAPKRDQGLSTSSWPSSTACWPRVARPVWGNGFVGPRSTTTSRSGRPISAVSGFGTIWAA